MTKLKTLKDITYIPHKDTILVKNLKEEAKRWHDKIKEDHPGEATDKNFTLDAYIQGQLDWITIFFGLDEDE